MRLPTFQRSYWNFSVLGVLALGSLFIAATRVRPTGKMVAPIAKAATAPAPQPNHAAPDFNLVDLSGHAVSLGDFKGQVVLINIWATWCAPCRAEMPTIEAAYARYRDRGFTVLAVNLKEQPRTVAAFIRDYRLSFPALLDVDGAVSNLYRAYALPSSFFVDRQGVVRAVYRGPMPRSVIAGTVEQLLGEDP